MPKHALFPWKAKQGQRHLGCPFVLHRDDHQIRDFYTAWRSACEDASVPGIVVLRLAPHSSAKYGQSWSARASRYANLGHKPDPSLAGTTSFLPRPERFGETDG